MGPLGWLFDATLTVAGYDVLWREIVGNLFGLAAAVGGLRRRVWAWPVGVVGNVLLFTVFLSNVLFGSLGVTFAMGLAGGVVSLTAMVLVSRIQGMHPVTVSIVGGVMHMVGQIGMALVVVNTPGLLTVLPFLMITGLVCGAITGVCADRVMKYMKHMRF